MIRTVQRETGSAGHVALADARSGVAVLTDLADRLGDVLTGPGAAAPLPAGFTSAQTTAGRSPGTRPRSLRSVTHGSRYGAEPVATPRTDDHMGVEAEVEDGHAESWRLVRLAQNGDAEAFGQLYDRYVDTVYRFVYFRINDRTLAEDFTSETFLRALRRIGTFHYQGRDIGAWFVTIARNIVFDHLKSARNRLESPTADTIEGREHNPSTETSVLMSLDSQRLMSAVAQLGDEQRECIVLRFIQGMSVSETATIMGKNDGAVKALQHRAVRKLADLVGDDLR